MRHFSIPVALIAGIAFAGNAQAQQNHASKYAGQEFRAIKSLSQDDIDELRRGGGWGLAKAAELNGVPGPAHLLELKDEIPLTPDQVGQISAIFADMKKAAIAAGEKLIALETGMEDHFSAGTMTDVILRDFIDRISSTRAQLRYIHLSTHLQTPKILSQDQIARYNALRGYGGDDPCANVPQGHDAAMWRKHNGCS